MNRKQVLKNMKKNKKNAKVIEEDNLVSRFIFTIGIVLVVLIAGYLFIGTFVTKTLFNKTKEEKQEVTIDNNTILAGQIFDQKDAEYYVLIYDVDDEKSSLGKWKGLKSSDKIYVVDSGEKLNNKFIVEKDSNKNPTGYSDLKIKNPTLIKVKDKKVIEYTEGEEEIKNIFKK